MTFEERVAAKAKAEGIAEGIAKGIAENKAEIALNMYYNGISKEMISKCIELPSEEIDKLIENSKQSLTETNALT